MLLLLSLRQLLLRVCWVLVQVRLQHLLGPLHGPHVGIDAPSCRQGQGQWEETRQGRGGGAQQ